MEEVRKRSARDGEKEVKVMPSCPSRSTALLASLVIPLIRLTPEWQQEKSEAPGRLTAETKNNSLTAQSALAV